MKQFYARQLPHGRATTGNKGFLWANYFRFSSKQERDDFVDSSSLRGIIEAVKLNDKDHMRRRREIGFYSKYGYIELDRLNFELYDFNKDGL